MQAPSVGGSLVLAVITALQAAVQKEKESSRGNLKKLVAVTKEKKDVETKLQAQMASGQDRNVGIG